MARRQSKRRLPTVGSKRPCDERADRNGTAAGARPAARPVGARRLDPRADGLSARDHAHVGCGPADAPRRRDPDPVHGRQPGHASDEPLGGGQRRRLRDEPELPHSRDPGRCDERALRRAAHAPERGDRPRGAPARRGRRPHGRCRGRRHSRAGRERRAGAVARPRHDHQRAARRRFARGRRVDRRRRRGLHWSRRADVAAFVDRARRQRTRHGRARGRLRPQWHRQHARPRRRQRAGRLQRLADLAVAARLGPRDAAVRRRPLVAARPRRHPRRRADRRGRPVRCAARPWSRRAPGPDRSRPGVTAPARAVRAGLAPAAQRLRLVAGRPARVRSDLRFGQRQRADHDGPRARVVPEHGRLARHGHRLVHVDDRARRP